MKRRTYCRRGVFIRRHTVHEKRPDIQANETPETIEPAAGCILFIIIFINTLNAIA